MNFWREAKQAFEDLRQAQAVGDKGKILEALQRLDATFKRESSELTLKQRKLCMAYIGESDGNGTESARLAGYKGNDVTLAAVAYENLRKPQIQDAIRKLRSEAEQKASDRILSATEVLVGLSKIAQADIADVIDDPLLRDAQQRGVSKLIKSMNFDKDTGRVTRIEMHNAHAAHVDVGKYWKLFTEKIEIANPQEKALEAYRAILEKYPSLEPARAKLLVSETFGIEVDQISDANS